jgi:hypothetical protein
MKMENAAELFNNKIAEPESAAPKLKIRFVLKKFAQVKRENDLESLWEWVEADARFMQAILKYHRRPVTEKDIFKYGTIEAAEYIVRPMDWEIGEALAKFVQRFCIVEHYGDSGKTVSRHDPEKWCEACGGDYVRLDYLDAANWEIRAE